MQSEMKLIDVPLRTPNPRKTSMMRLLRPINLLIKEKRVVRSRRKRRKESVSIVKRLDTLQGIAMPKVVVPRAKARGKRVKIRERKKNRQRKRRRKTARMMGCGWLQSAVRVFRIGLILVGELVMI